MLYSERRRLVKGYDEWIQGIEEEQHVKIKKTLVNFVVFLQDRGFELARETRGALAEEIKTRVGAGEVLEDVLQEIIDKSLVIEDWLKELEEEDLDDDEEEEE